MLYPNLKAVYRKGTLKLQKPLKIPDGTAVQVSVQISSTEAKKKPTRYMNPNNPQPAGSFEKMIGLIAAGGDALADTEALYDGDE